MSHINSTKLIAKTSLLYIGLALALVVAVPLLAGLAFAARIVVPVAIVGGLLALALSPAVRRWFAQEADDAPDYKGIPFPAARLLVHPAHGWADIQGDSARIGVDALAVTALGKISSVEAPPVGAKIAQGEVLFTLRRGDRRLQVRAPLGGVVAAVNTQAVEAPTTLTTSPYVDGWVVRLQEVGAGGEAARLMRDKPLRRWFRSEIDRLAALLSPPGQPVATMSDGGALVPDLADHIDDRAWSEIAGQLFSNPR